MTEWLAILALSAAQPAAAAPAPFNPSEAVACGRPDANPHFCKLDRRFTEAEARAVLGDRRTAWRAQGDRFTVFARRPGEHIKLCCALKAEMDRVGDTDIWTVSLHVPELDRATLDVLVGDDEPDNIELPAYRGPHAPPAPRFAKTLKGAVTDETFASAAVGETRRLSIYTPPGFDPARRYPVVYMADGYVLSGYARIIDPLIARGTLRPVVLVGLWPNRGADQDYRRLEYVEGYEPGSVRFRKVEAELLTEVMPMAERRYGASRDPRLRMVWGTSAGSAWSLSMGARHPDLFGQAAALSMGWRTVADQAVGEAGPRLFLSAGLFEPDRLVLNEDLARRARAAGRQVVLRTPVTGHSFLQWQPEMIEALNWAFGRPGQ